MTVEKVGNIIELFYSTKNTRVTTSELSLDVKGVIKDKFYDKDIERSVLISSLKSYILVNDHGIDAPYGILGENILVDYNPYHLKTGTRLLIGEVVLEISQRCTLCKSLAKTDTKLPKILKNDRGIFAKVINGGTIHKNDFIYLLSDESL